MKATYIITKIPKTIENIGGKKVMKIPRINMISIRVGRIFPVRKKLNELRALVPLAIFRVTPPVA